MLMVFELFCQLIEPWHIVIKLNNRNERTFLFDQQDLDIIKITDVSSDDNIQITEIFNIFYETPSILKSQLETILAGENVEEGSTLTIVENDQNKTLIVKATEVLRINEH